MDTLKHRIELCQAAAEQLTQYLQTLPAEAWCHPSACEAWCHPSACEAWEVRDVVAHLTLGAELYATVLSRGLQGDRAPLEGFPPSDAPNRAAFVAARAIAYRDSVGGQLLGTFTARHDHLQRPLFLERFPGIVARNARPDTQLRTPFR